MDGHAATNGSRQPVTSMPGGGSARTGLFAYLVQVLPESVDVAKATASDVRKYGRV